jgi:predicted ArsR family transcriptional regulator
MVNVTVTNVHQSNSTRKNRSRISAEDILRLIKIGINTSPMIAANLKVSSHGIWNHLLALKKKGLVYATGTKPLIYHISKRSYKKVGMQRTENNPKSDWKQELCDFVEKLATKIAKERINDITAKLKEECKY